MAELLVISLALLFTVTGSNRQGHSLLFQFPTATRVVLAAILLLSGISSSLAEAPSSAILESGLFLGLFLCCAYIGGMARDNPRVFQKTIIALLAVADFCYQANFFSAFLASFIENIPLQWPEPFSGFSNVRFFNQFQIWSIVLLPLSLLLYPALDKRLATGLKIIATGWAVLLFASGSRGAVASVFTAMLLTLIVFRQHARPFLLINIRILAAGFCAYWLLFQLLPMLAESQVTLGWRAEKLARTQDRFVLWRFAVQYVIDHPWLGIGPMHYAYYPGPANAHPHNSILQWASEMGIPSALLVIYLTVTGLLAWVRKFYRRQADGTLGAPPHLWIGLFCALSSGLFYSLFSGVIVMPLSQVMMALIVGWMLGLYYYDHVNRPVSRLQQRLMMMLAGACLITLTYTVMPGLLPRLMSYESLSQRHYPMVAPRFWQIGGIAHEPGQ